MYYFTSDMHFGHDNIRKYCKRPFASVGDMNRTIITNWNNVVTSSDVVYVLGDISFPSNVYQSYLNKLNGHKILVRGNHDRKIEAPDIRSIKIDGTTVILCHYAMRIWPKRHYGAYHLYGHSHGTLKIPDNELSMDVGVDCWNFTPVSWTTIDTEMRRRLSIYTKEQLGILDKGEKSVKDEGM